MFLALDQFIIKKFTRYCHLFQKLTGRTNFFIAKIASLVVATAAMLRVLAHYIHFLPHTPSMIDVFLCTWITVILLRDAYLCDRAEEDLLNSEKAEPEVKLFNNIGVNRVSPGWRLIWIFFMILDISLFWSNIGKAPNPVLYCIQDLFSPGLFVFYYCLMVDPLPPGKSERHRWHICRALSQ